MIMKFLLSKLGFSVKKDETEPPSNVLQVSVADTGQGIANETEPTSNVPPELIIDSEARESLGPLLALRSLVWERVPAPVAKDFDEALYGVQTVLRLLRSYNERIDSEVNMASFLDDVDEEVGHCDRALRACGDTATAEAMSKAIAALSEPARAHLERVRVAPRVHAADKGTIVRLSPEEYLLLCASCDAPAERLRIISSSVCFTNDGSGLSPPCFPQERVAELFAILERDGAHALCEMVEREDKVVIGYCPECRALYCPRHYETRATWSGSWLEAVHGTCVRKHRRELA